MPRVIECRDTHSASLEETIDTLGDEGFDPLEEDSLMRAAKALRRLGNNRGFLGDLLIEQLAGCYRNTIDSAYGPQAIVLSPLRGGCFLRANIWPGENDACFQASGARSFVYGLPHDHNFSFLTLGYFGPGYASDYYEYDYSSTVGYSGERPGLRFIERSALEEGKLMLYRAHRDIHSQLPAQSMSVSLNIMHIHPAQGWFDQYGFDLERGTITGVLSPTSTETFLRCAVGMGNQEAIDLAEYFGRHHPSDRLRLASYEARAMIAVDDEERENIWRAAERSGSNLLAVEAWTRLKDMAA